ncbi:hypothetical protein [Streptomyces sp. A1136]|uniref:hypothetical protein n=1 Tax=Streptomyces sp. A1136 TaxID=2563102 RepID=UPI00109E73E6|nr:hypothetical protein [Streptomyces sp. A1136]THA56126.1 hypothetical protein E6R62_12330 [Streptomyces sp. A1136]
MTADEELHAAARLLLDRAADAIHEDRLTWATGHTLGSKSPVVVDDQERPSVLIETWAPRREAVNAYLALLGPATGLALADWLAETAVELTAAGGFAAGALDSSLDRSGPHNAWSRALVLARAILGSKP